VAEDPGWKPAIKGVWRMLVPGGAAMISKRVSALTTTRTFAVGAFLGWMAVAGFLALLDQDLTPTTAAEGVAVFGAIEVILIAVLRRRSLAVDSAKRLRQSFAQTFFLGYVLANAAMIFAFFTFFRATRGQLLTYLIGIPFAAFGLWLIAPTKARLAGQQVRLEAAGSELVVLEVLEAPPEPIPQKQRPQRRQRW
jgi:hypothetical protein